MVEYACAVWHTSLTKGQSDQLESVQRRVLHAAYPDLSYRRALQAAGLQTLYQRREAHESCVLPRGDETSPIN